MLKKYRNGNADITIDNDGTRTVEYEGMLSLEYPLNIDIRVSTRCSFGALSDGSPGFCTFCHESAHNNGSECNYDMLQWKIQDLPQGIELAIGCNVLTANLMGFLRWCRKKGYICNITINQGHVHRDLSYINAAIKEDIVKGLGISFRGSLPFNIPKPILDYSNTVFHVIAGIDDFKTIKGLHDKGVRKVLVLGEKDFGFNAGRVDINSRCHKEWRWWVRTLYDVFDVVSFDNLAGEQLNIRRFFTDKHWQTFYQGEHSMYIDAVKRTFAPSSRSDEIESWDCKTVKDYFTKIDAERTILQYA